MPTAETVDTKKNRLGNVLRKWRLVVELDQNAVAEEIGISASSYARLEQGRGCDATTMLKVMTWLMEPVNEAPPQQKLIQDA